MNTTELATLWGYSSKDLEIANLIQGGCSFVATCIILIRVLDIPSFFKSVRERRALRKREKERKELERIKRLMKGVQNFEDFNINQLLSSDDDEESKSSDKNRYKIAHKKNSAETRV